MRLDVVVADLDVFAPPGSSPLGYSDEPQSGERLKTAIGVLAVLGVVALAVVYVGSVDGEADADDAASDLEDDGTADIDERVDDPAVDQGEDEAGSDDPEIIARGAGLLDRVAHAELDQGWPVAALSHGGEAMVFLSPRASWVQTNVGLDLWVGTDFNDLTQLAGVIPVGSEIADVAVFASELIALGTDEAGTLTIWRSTDGRAWTPEALPQPAEESAWGVGGSQILIGDAGIALVVSRTQGAGIGDTTAAILDHLDLPGDAATDFEIYEDFDSITLGAPFGFRFATATFEELGLPERDMTEEPPPVVWYFNDGSGWESQEFETPWLQSVGVDAAGDFYAVEWRGPGTQLLRSTDGRTWTETSLIADPDTVLPWKDDLLTASSYDVALVVEGTTNHLGLRTFAPSAATNGNYANLRAGDGGVAVMHQSWSDSRSSVSSSTTFIKEPYTLTSDDGWTLELQRDGVLVWSSSGGPGEDSYVADLAGRTVTLLDQESGEPLVDFTIEQLRQLAGEAEVPIKTVPDQVLFSRDLTDWYRGILGSVSDPGTAWYQGPEFIDGQIAVFGFQNAFPRWGYTLPTIDLWLFDLPEDGE